LGYQQDSTGLQLLGHRYYDPSTGRFLTRDPIKDGRNWYGYCENNPVRSVDPEGLQAIAIPKKAWDPIRKRLKPWEQEFDSEEEAAEFVLDYIYPEARKPRKDGRSREMGGYIYRKGNRFKVTRPVTGGPAGISYEQMEKAWPPGGRGQSGWYHTHQFDEGEPDPRPGGTTLGDPDTFSEGDKQWSAAFGRAYMRSSKGRIWMYDPSTGLVKEVRRFT